MRYYRPEPLTKDEAYKELEDLAFSMSKIMSESGIDIFEFQLSAPQRHVAWKVTAETWEDKHED